MAPKAHTVSLAGDILDARPALEEKRSRRHRKGRHIVLESHIRFDYTGMDSRCSAIFSVSVMCLCACAFPSAYLPRLHILGTYELAYTHRMAWFFGVDYLDYLWNFLYRFTGIHRPNYTSDEDDSGGIFFSDRPPVTGYRLLVTSTIFVVGMTKSVLVYGNRQTDATSLECVVGVFGGIGYVGLIPCEFDLT